MSKKIVMDNFECKITINHFHPAPSTSKSARFRGDIFYENDRWGRSFLTHIQTRFDHDPPVELYSKYNDDIFEKSLKAVNRLLKVSRLVLNQFFISHIIPEDIDTYNTKLFGENNAVITGGIMGMNPGELQTVTGKFSITDDEKDLLDDYLENNREIPIHELLLKNSKDYLFLENYRAALIECEAAFETCVSKVLYSGFRKDGDTHEVADRKIEETPFANLLQHHLDKFLNAPFYGSDEHKKWKIDCYGKRNKLVHAGVIPNDHEVQDAISAVKEAIEYLLINKTS